VHCRLLKLLEHLAACALPDTRTPKRLKSSGKCFNTRFAKVQGLGGDDVTAYG